MSSVLGGSRGAVESTKVAAAAAAIVEEAVKRYVRSRSCVSNGGRER